MSFKKTAGRLIPLAFAVILLTTCGALDPLDEGSEESFRALSEDRSIFPYDLIVPLESNIVFKVMEGFEHPYVEALPRILLYMETEKIYPCCNYPIIYDASIDGSVISIDVQGVYISPICLTALGPAGGSGFLDILPGVYSLEFNYSGTMDSYTLTVTESSIEVAAVASQFTVPEFTLFHRYPPRSFAYLCGTTQDTAWICDDFLSVLKNGVNLVEFQFPPTGEIPYPTSTSGYYVNHPARYFHYQTEDDFAKAGAILETYSQNVISQYTGVGVSLRNWRNVHYLSWLYD